jgi:hypothetical protein
MKIPDLQKHVCVYNSRIIQNMGLKMKEFTGKAKGAAAKNASMTPEERKAHAQKMVEARRKRAKLPKATHFGVLRIQNIEIQCYVLPQGNRVLSMRGISDAFTGTRGGGVRESGAHILPRFMGLSGLKPFIHKDFMARAQPVEFLPSHKGRSAFGINATILPEICGIVLEARDAGTLSQQHAHLARQADLLMRGLATVGIIALVDEATGYQKDRARDALAQILEKFVAKELQPWVKTFPADYYEHLFRLYGIPFPPEKPQWRPQFFGKITNDVIYDRLAPELLPELKKSANKAEKRGKLHQWLTNDIGHPKLREHLASIVTLLKLAGTPEEFKSLVDRVHPRFGDTLSLEI